MAPERPVIRIAGQALDNVEDFTYLGSTILDKLSLEAEIKKRIGKTATTFALELQQADTEDQDRCLPRLRPEHPCLRQRNLANV